MSESSARNSRAVHLAATVAEDMAVAVVVTRIMATIETTITRTAATATATPPPRQLALQCRRLRRPTLRRQRLTTPRSTLSITAPTRMPPTVATKPTFKCISNGRLLKPHSREALLLLLRAPRPPRRLRPRARQHRPLLLHPQHPHRRPLPDRRVRVGIAL
jgi:hypothetical protein